jgi:hypothetical protein
MRIMHALSPAALCAVLLAAAFIAPSALAGTADIPEISDIKDGTRDSRDILAVWFDGETNDTIDATMNLTALESYTNPQEIPNLPTTEYEVYFSVGDKNYSVACSVPVHGPVGLLISFEIRSVTYVNATSEPTETRIATFSGTYSVSSHTIQYPISKTEIGEPKAGTHLSKTWAAVWNTNRGQTDRTLEDRAPNAGYGMDYIVRGSAGAEIIDVKMSTDTPDVHFKPNEKAEFKLNVLNNGTSTVNIALSNQTVDKGWTCTLSNENLTLPVNKTIVVTVTVTCPRDAKNNTTEKIYIGARVRTGTNQTGSASIILTAVVDYIPPATTTSSNPLTAFINWIKAHPKDFYMYLGIIIAVIVVLAVAVIAVRSIRKKRELSAGAPAQT